MKQIYDNSMDLGKPHCDFLDHQPAWDGDHSYTCSECGLEFRSIKYIKNTILALIDAEIDMLEKQIKEVIQKKEQIENDPFHPVRCQYLGQEDALKNHLTYLKEQRELIK